MEPPEGDAHSVLMQQLRQQITRHRLPDDPAPYEYCKKYLCGGNQDAKMASVLVAFFLQGGELRVLLTKRSTTLRGYSGDVSFPGGMCEPSDLDHVDTCLRETEEEIGVPRAMVSVLGTLYPGMMSTGVCVVPVIGVIPNHLPFYPNDEVDVVFSLPLRRFLQSKEHYQKYFQPQGANGAFQVHFFNDQVDGQAITTFGFTAHVCMRLAVAVFQQEPEFACDGLSVENPYREFRIRYEQNISRENAPNNRVKHKL